MKIIIFHFLFIFIFLPNLQASFKDPLLRDEELIKAFQLDNQLEIENFILKLKLEDEIQFVNTLKFPQKIIYQFCLKNEKKGFFQAFKRNITKLFSKPNLKFLIEGNIQVPAGRSFTLAIPKNYFLKTLRYNSSVFLKIKIKTHDIKSIIYISDKPTLAFPLHLTFFDFSPRLIYNPYKPTLQKYFDPNNPLLVSNLKKRYKRKFDDTIKFIIEQMCPYEGIDPDVFFKQRQDLYSLYNLNQLFFKANFSGKKIPYRIPQMIHRIWLTTSETPIELPLKYVEWAEISAFSNPSSQGWRHIMWVQDKNKIPETVKNLKNISFEIKELKELQIAPQHLENVNQALQDQKFGKASDILRYIILQKYGGIYADNDYIIAQSCTVFNKLYDFYAGLEPTTVFIGNAFIAARPDHPVINRVLEIVKRNLSKNSTVSYNDNNSLLSKTFETVLLTGPIPLTVAFYQAAGKIINQQPKHDILFPPIIIYPTLFQSYPQKTIADPGMAIPAESLGIHFWDTLWSKKKFKSEG